MIFKILDCPESNIKQFSSAQESLSGLIGRTNRCKIKRRRVAAVQSQAGAPDKGTNQWKDGQVYRTEIYIL